MLDCKEENYKTMDILITKSILGEIKSILSSFLKGFLLVKYKIKNTTDTSFKLQESLISKSFFLGRLQTSNSERNRD